jgi:hypothetical protein
MGIKPDGKAHEDELKARLFVASAVIEHIEENHSLSLTDEALNLIKTKYEIRIQRIRKDQLVPKIQEALVENPSNHHCWSL